MDQYITGSDGSYARTAAAHFDRRGVGEVYIDYSSATYHRMIMIAFLTLELRIEAAHSLKDKRQVTRSLKDRLRASFNVGVAELDPGPLWNQATIGVVGISHSHDYLDGLMKNVERAATRIANNAGAEVTDSFVEFL